MRYSVEDLFADPALSAMTLSPDGQQLGYLAPAGGRTNVWIRGVDDDHDDAVCVTHDTRRGIKTFRWSSDPRYLLYLQDTDGNEDWHLFRVDLTSPDQPPLDLTPEAPGVRVLSYEVVDDGKVAVTMNRRLTHTDAFLIDLESGSTTLLHEAPEASGTFLLGRSGRVVYAQQRPDGVYEYSRHDSEGWEVFHREGGPERPVGISPAHVTPDGQALLLGSFGDGDDLHLVRIDIATGSRTVVVALPGHDLCTMGYAMPALPPCLLFSRRTGEVIAARFTGPRPHLEPVDDHFSEVLARLEALSEGVLASAVSDVSERFWVATFTHDREPGLTWHYDHHTGEARLIARPYPQLDPAHMAPMTPVRLTARDGLPLHGFLTLPLGVEPRDLPLVLKVHGGPWAHDSWTFDRDVQLLANRGYAVLQVNFRGSTGYGRTHITAAVGEFAGKMHTDLLDAINWAVANGWADPDRVGIVGGSYGGYSALVGAAFTPDVFAAAVDIVGISDLAHFMRTLPAFVKPLLRISWYHYVGDPEDPAQEAAIRARSPISRLDDIRTPLLIAQGANDARVVQAESDNIVTALRDRGVHVEYLLAHDEGHGFQNPENLVWLWNAIDEHFARHLMRSTQEES